jgi:DNA repair exonuclease SbcCD nuclease subunit
MLTKRWKQEHLSIASISDIHLGHASTPTEEIIERLKEAFPDDHTTAELDLLILAGDVFDQILLLPDTSSYAILRWISGLLKVCKKHDVVVRVLEGTPGHDRGQGRHFVEINETSRIGADVRYVDILEVELLDRLGISLLYIPDEWERNPDVTWEQAQRAVREAGLEQVDVAVMHGMFEYQLPAHLNFTHHRSERYLKLVKGPILIGHVHTCSNYERIYVAGSFDRIKHAEQEDKGHWRLHVQPSMTEISATFIVNKKATRYDTIDCTNLTVDEWMDTVHDRCLELLEFTDQGLRKAFVRLQHTDDQPVSEHIDTLRKRYPFIGWKTAKVVNQTNRTVDSNDELNVKHQAVELHKTNAFSILEHEVNNVSEDVSPLIKHRALELLKSIT